MLSIRFKKAVLDFLMSEFSFTVLYLAIFELVVFTVMVNNNYRPKSIILCCSLFAISFIAGRCLSYEDNRRKDEK